jgi:hypothetical protein
MGIGLFDKLLERMAASGIASADELRGCKDHEIAALEARYALRLPMTYRLYLELMGHCSGRLFTSDHMAVFYGYVIEMTDDVRARRIAPNRMRYSDDSMAPPWFSLPKGTLIISGRLDAAWEIIRCTGESDSPIWFFDENDWEIRQSAASVLDWLNCWCGRAEKALASGYFRKHPGGTIP